MISEEHGDLLQASADALVNAVNTAGVMGKGIALQFKEAYPANFRSYEAACRRGEIRLGRMFTYETGLLDSPRFIINFPTKGHWRARSRLSDIKAGLTDLREEIRNRDIRSIAIPPLGCGNGGIDWRDVRPLMIEALGDLPGVHVMVFPPEGPPPAKSMKLGTKRPTMTTSRACMLATVARYVRQSHLEDAMAADGASLLEIQKLMYLLQEAGQTLGLNYVKARYGPYADNLNHTLQSLEGHYLRGYGDRTQEVLKLSPIVLLPDAEAEAQQWLDGHTDDGTADRINAVVELFEGFASAYGLELLATVHWVATHELGTCGADPAALTELIRNWSERKGRLFTEVHIHRAAEHLSRFQWLAGQTASH